MLNYVDIESAAKRIAPFINHTPTVSSSLLNNWLGHTLYFKAECCQKIGAFKARGGCNAVAKLTELGNKPNRIIANSSGNHAQAVAYAGRQFGIPATIYMPDYSSQVKIQATRSYGADVVLCQSREEADTRVAEAAQEKNVYWIPPYNHEDVIAGQGTAAYEALKETGPVDAVFAPCGGGGLLSGTWISTRYLAPKALVIGAEPLAANDAAESLRTGQIQSLKQKPDTLADGAMTVRVGDITFEYLKQLDGFYEIDENTIVYWTQWLTHLLKLHVEPTSAMSMGAVCQWLKAQKTQQKVLVILSGGNIDVQTNRTIWATDQLTRRPDLLESETE